MKKYIILIKKYSLYTILMGIIFMGTHTSIVHGQADEAFYYGQEYQGDDLSEIQKTELGQVVMDDSVGESNSDNITLLYQIRQYFRLTGNTTYDQDQPAIAYVKMIMNIALGLTSFISLVLIIFAFYLMFFQKGEEGFAKAKKILAGIAIALVIMGLSWIIVSFFFEIYSTQAVKNI